MISYPKLNPNSPFHMAIKDLIDNGYVQAFKHDDTGEMWYMLTDKGEQVPMEVSEEEIYAFPHDNMSDEEIETMLKNMEKDLDELILA